MTVKKRGLGRGLDALLAPQVVANEEQTDEVVEQLTGLTYLDHDLLCKGKFQPRRDMNSVQLDELAISIKQQGIMQPIVVRPIESGKYEIIAGERRWRAAKIAELSKFQLLCVMWKILTRLF
jgi:ParB family chromosome partitioning protein